MPGQHRFGRAGNRPPAPGRIGDNTGPAVADVRSTRTGATPAAWTTAPSGMDDRPSRHGRPPLAHAPRAGPALHFMAILEAKMKKQSREKSRMAFAALAVAGFLFVLSACATSQPGGSQGGEAPIVVHVDNLTSRVITVDRIVAVSGSPREQPLQQTLSGARGERPVTRAHRPGERSSPSGRSPSRGTRPGWLRRCCGSKDRSGSRRGNVRPSARACIT